MTPVAQVNHPVAQSLAQRRTFFTKRDDFVSYIKINYTADRGDSIQETSCFIEPSPTRLQGSLKAGFHDDDIPTTHIAVAVEDVKLVLTRLLSHRHAVHLW
jgi:hypothetical protein